jgi:hypothetical protein
MHPEGQTNISKAVFTSTLQKLSIYVQTRSKDRYSKKLKNNDTIMTLEKLSLPLCSALFTMQTLTVDAKGIFALVFSVEGIIN